MSDYMILSTEPLTLVMKKAINFIDASNWRVRHAVEFFLTSKLMKIRRDMRTLRKERRFITIKYLRHYSR